MYVKILSKQLIVGVQLFFIEMTILNDTVNEYFSCNNEISSSRF